MSSSREQLAWAIATSRSDSILAAALATVVALIWANAPVSDSYFQVLDPRSVPPHCI